MVDINLEPIHEKLDKLNETMTQVQISQSRTEVIMEEHIRRTAAAEENIGMLRGEFKPIKDQVLQAIAGAHTLIVIAKILAGVFTIAGVVLSLIKFFR